MGNGFLPLVALAPLLLGDAVAAGEVPEDRQRALVHLLRHDCGSCHGMTLRGGLGPPLTAAALEGKSRRALEATILFGRPGTPMPPWAGMLSEDEVRWLVEALKSGSVQ
jgi:cytochrome c55X